MGNLRKRWTPEEQKALREGVAKHGVGNWKSILDDPQFSHILSSRSNVSLKDKWRNISRATQKQKESLTADEETALGALGELRYGVDNSKSIQEELKFKKCSDSGSDVEFQNMKVEASMPQPAIQDQSNSEFNLIAVRKRRLRKRKMSEIQSEFDANAQAETDAEEESEARPSQSLLQKMPEVESDEEAEVNSESETKNKE